MTEKIQRYVKLKIEVWIPDEANNDKQIVSKIEDYSQDITFGFRIEEEILGKLHLSLIKHALIKNTDYESFRYYFDPYIVRPPFLSKIYWNSKCKGSVEILLHRIFRDTFKDEKEYRTFIIPKIPYIFRTWDRKPLTLYNKSSLPYNDEDTLKKVFEEVYGKVKNNKSVNSDA